jgi:hypothetical protein
MNDELLNPCRELQGLQQERDAVLKTQNLLVTKADVLWDKVKQRLGLAADVGRQRMYHCFLARLSPELYPYRPKISFLLQHWKRPNSIDRIMQAFVNCKDKVRNNVAIHIGMYDEHPC